MEKHGVYNEEKLRVIERAVYDAENIIHKISQINEEMSSTYKAEWLEMIGNIKKELGDSPTLLFIGPFSSGKSTLINALLHVEDFLPTADKPCTSIITELNFVEGGGDRGRLFRQDLSSEPEDDLKTLIKKTDGSNGDPYKAAQYHHIEAHFDITKLPDYDESHSLKDLADRKIKLIDCPGYGSPYFSNPEAINEYISKANFTFWMSPANRFGGAMARSQLSDIKKRTTALIPVLTMADLIDEGEKEKVADEYIENLGDMFPSLDKYPIFVSAKNALIADAMKKKLKKERDKLDKDEIMIREKQIEELTKDAGLFQLFSKIVFTSQQKNAAYMKIESALYDLSELYKSFNSFLNLGTNYWRKKLEENGWAEDDKYRKWNEVKKEVDYWIDCEAEMVSDKLKTAMISQLTTKVLNEKNKRFDSHEIQLIVAEIWRKELELKRDKWAEHLKKSYANAFTNINVDKDLKTPDFGGSIGDELKARIMGIIESIKFAGFNSILMGSIGAVVTASSGALANVMLIGGALSAIAIVAGPLLIAAAVFPLFPIISDAQKRRKEELRRETEAKLREWMAKAELAPVIKELLSEQSEKLFNMCKDKTGNDILIFEKNYNKCGEIKKEIEDKKERIRQHFPAFK